MCYMVLEGFTKVLSITKYGTTLNCGLFPEDGSGALPNSIMKKILDGEGWLRTLPFVPCSVCRKIT